MPPILVANDPDTVSSLMQCLFLQMLNMWLAENLPAVGEGACSSDTDPTGDLASVTDPTGDLASVQVAIVVVGKAYPRKRSFS